MLLKRLFALLMRLVEVVTAKFAIHQIRIVEIVVHVLTESWTHSLAWIAAFLSLARVKGSSSLWIISSRNIGVSPDDGVKLTVQIFWS